LRVDVHDRRPGEVPRAAVRGGEPRRGRRGFWVVGVGRLAQQEFDAFIAQPDGVRGGYAAATFGEPGGQPAQREVKEPVLYFARTDPDRLLGHRAVSAGGHRSPAEHAVPQLTAAVPSERLEQAGREERRGGEAVEDPVLGRRGLTF